MNYRDNENFSNEFKSFIEFIENVLNRELPSPLTSVEYFVLGFLDKKDSYANKLLSVHLTSLAMNAIRDTYFDILNKKALTAIKPNRELKFDATATLLLTGAENEMKKCGETKITTVHLLLALLENYLVNNSIKKVFNKAGVDYNLIFSKKDSINNTEVQPQQQQPNILTQIQNAFGNNGPQKIEIIGVNNINDISNLLTGQNNKKKGNSAIDNYCIDITQQVRERKIDNIIGRTHELSEIIKVLCRRKKNNVIIVGDSGVGKTALAGGLAYLIEDNNIPSQLRNKRIMQLNPTAMIGGTQWRGMFEERLNTLISELKKQKNVILFIDDISQVFNEKGSMEKDGGNSWNGLLEDGDVQIIATSDFKGYRTITNTIPSFTRRFQKLVIDEPSIDETIKILYGLKPEYEKFHHVKYDNETIMTCVELSQKYLTERRLPDSAIDVMDEIGAKLNISQSNSEKLITSYKKKKELENEIDKLKKKDKFSDASEMEKELNNLIVEISQEETKIEEQIKRQPTVITKNDVLEMFSETTKIPVNNLNSNDKHTLKDIDKIIKEDVIGQDEAVDKICNAIKRNRIGLSKTATYGNFLLIGNTGVGKTFLAKKLAKLLFGDENKMVRFDFSEYTDKTATNKLIGSNPGYVGYENGGLLTEAIKNKKHCVLLLDEIEKADKEIFNLFLQVFDEGFLTDNVGEKIDFKNVIILATSNAGTKTANAFGKGIGFSENTENNKKNILIKEVKKKFPPEFINRFNDIIYFNTLTDDNLRIIIANKLEEYKEDVFKKTNIIITYYDCVVDYILNFIEKEKEFGARPIIRAIETELMDKLSDTILNAEEEIQECIFSVDENDELQIRRVYKTYHDNLNLYINE